MLMVFNATLSALDQIVDIHIVIYYVWFMVLNVTFNNILVMVADSCFFLVQETGVPGENHRPATSHWQTVLT